MDGWMESITIQFQLYIFQSNTNLIEQELNYQFQLIHELFQALVSDEISKWIFLNQDSRFPLPDGPGQVKLPDGQWIWTDFSSLFHMSRSKNFKFLKSGKWWFWEKASPAKFDEKSWCHTSRINFSFRLHRNVFPRAPLNCQLRQQQLVQVMAWCKTGNKPLPASEPIIA